MQRILVIDDDASLGILLAKIFSRQYQVTVMNNGFEAWRWLAEGNYPDIIVSDINMPVVDGLELLENLSHSSLFKDIPVVILSGFKDSTNRNACLSLGAHAYLVKPFEPQGLLDTVARVLKPITKVYG